MSFSINTNIASLNAQNYLSSTSQLQTNTIGRVTSGLRITRSGDDAAGLAIANSYRSDEAVLAQGIRNANDGIGQLQIIDSGVNNISQLLDRARTLATQSASGTFTGDRKTLNAEFQSVLQEIDREAQAIGLNQGGQFATSLSVFIGGGKSSVGGGAATAVANGVQTLDLSKATVDAKSLGLSGVRVVGGTAGTTDIGTGSATSVQNIVTNATNTATEKNVGFTEFAFEGPGFSDTTGNNVVKISVNLSGVTDSNSLVNAVNAAIAAQGSAGSQQATAFKNAGISASSVTDSTGKTQLTFNSSASSFQVTGGDSVATALLGQFASAGSPIGTSATPTVTGATTLAATATASTVQLRILGAGLSSAQTVSVTINAGDNQAALVADVNAAIAGNASLAATGITASLDTAGTSLVFNGKAGQTFEAQTSGDTTNQLGFGSYKATGNAPANFDYNSITAGAAVVASKTQGVQVSINGGTAIDLGVLTGGTTELAQLASLNTAFQANAATRAAGLTAINNGGSVEIVASSGTNFRLNTYGGSGDAFGFGASAVGSALSAGTAQSTYAAKTQIDAQGANQSNATGAHAGDVFTFSGLRNTGDQQNVTLSVQDANGAPHSLNVTLNGSNASTLDQALATINSALQTSNDLTLTSVVAFKELNAAGSQEGIRLASSTSKFSVSLGLTTNGVGLSDGGTQGAATLLTSSVFGSGGTADISNATSASAAVTALSAAVGFLGNAQATVGKGENQFQYAANLAQSQFTNETAAESQIRDANLAQESANLTKAQILLQAGVAALSQANSAPQQLLALLQGR